MTTYHSGSYKTTEIPSFHLQTPPTQNQTQYFLSDHLSSIQNQINNTSPQLPTHNTHQSIIMPRGGGTQTRVHLKGKEDDFIVFAESSEDVKKWRGDKSVPLAQVVNSFKVFVTHKHGAQGDLDSASNATLENEFGTKSEEEVIKQILEKGTVQETETADRQGSKNDSIGSRAAH